MANSGYYTEPKLNASGGSSLTIREADGTPSGVVTELVFPNTSVAIASGVGTLSVVPDSDPRLGVIWDAAINDGEVALECNNESWAFFSDPHRDNFKTALGLSTVATTGAFTDLSARPTTLSGYGITDAASLTHTHGNITNAGAIGTTADLPISTTASGVINTRTVADFRALLGLATTDSPTFNAVRIGGNQSITAPATSADVTITATGTGWDLGYFGLTRLRLAQSLLSLASNGGVRWSDTSNNAVGVGTWLVLQADAANTLAQRNGTNAQIFRVYKTFTAANTNFETFEVDAASDASNYRIGSRIGSAGGTTRGLQLGAYNGAGTWTSWLGIETSGNLSTQLGNVGVLAGGIAVGFAGTTTSNIAGGQINVCSSTSSKIAMVASQGINLANDMWLAFSSTTISSGSRDGRFQRHATATIGAYANSGLAVRNFDNNADAPVSCSSLTASSDLTLVPSSSRTLSTNGQFSIEMTSNTAGNLVYRGSDGTTRRMALTFS